MAMTTAQELRAEGIAEGKREAVLTVLRTRFRRVPKDVEKAIRQMTDPIVLDSWTVQAVACQSMDEFTMDEFTEALR